MKKVFICISLLLLMPFYFFAQSGNADVVILLDNSGTMLPFYDQITTQVLTEVSSKFVRLGDTVHLLSFSEKTTPEISQKINTEEDVQKLVSRFNLLYPIGPYTDFYNAVQYTQQYISSMENNSEKILVIISDGLYFPAPGSSSYNVPLDEVEKTIQKSISEMKDDGVHLYYVKAPFPNGVTISNLSGDTLVSKADTVQKTETNDKNSAADNAFSAAENAADNAFSAAENAADNAFAAAESAADNAFSAAENAADNAFRAAESAADNAFSAAESAADNAFRAAESAADNAFSAAENAADNAFSAAESAVDNAFSAAENAVDNAFSAAESAADNAFGAAENAADNAFSAAENAADNAFSAAESAADNAFGAAENAADNAFVAAESAADNAFSAAESAADNAFSAAESAVDNAFSAAESTVDNAFVAAESAVETPDYYAYNTTLEESEDVTSVEITETSEEDGILFNNDTLPKLSTIDNLGKVSYTFKLPLTIENRSDKDVNISMTNVFVDGIDVLKAPTAIYVKAKDTETQKIIFTLPDSFKAGEQIISAFFVFNDNVKTQPQQLSFIINLKEGFNFIEFFKTNWLWFVLALLILLLIILVIMAVKYFSGSSNSSKKTYTDKDYSEDLNNTNIKTNEAMPKINKDKATNGSMPTLNENNATNGSMPTLKGTSNSSNGSMPSLGKTNASSNGSMPSLKGNSSSNGSMPSLKGVNSSSNGSMPKLTSTNNSSNGSMPTLTNSNISSKGSMPTLTNNNISSKGSMPGLLSKAEQMNKKSNVPPANASEPIKVVGDSTITLDFVVEGQTRNIGFRNIHAMSPGSRKTVGGGFSTFSIFLVQVPSSIAEIRYDGKTCTLALLKPEFFPYEKSNIISDCIGKTFTVRATTGYEMQIHFEYYVSQTEKLNELLLSLVPEEDKKKYL